MRAQPEDGQLTGNEHFGHNLLVLAPFEVRAGMNRISPGPARRREQRIQAVGVCPLVGVWDYLAAGRLLTLGCTCDSPLDERGMKRHF